MCLIIKQKTIEEIIAQNSIGMTPEQKAQYWYEISQQAFKLLGKVDVTLYPIATEQFVSSIKSCYPSIIDVKIADGEYRCVTLGDLQKILIYDWSNLVPYIAEQTDCDKSATRLYSHLADYYKINTVIPIWGWVKGISSEQSCRHAFNLGVLKTDTGFIAKLVEPQNDMIFDSVNGDWGYTPDTIILDYITIGG